MYSKYKLFYKHSIIFDALSGKNGVIKYNESILSNVTGTMSSINKNPV